jgi:ABC-type transport system substrate-binding protein
MGVIAACSPAAAPATSQPQGGKIEGFLIPGTGAPKRGGTINLAALPPGPVHWDPSTGGANNGASGWMSPYEYLFRPRNSFFGDTTMQPGLAESWEVSADGLTYSFHIRKGVKWQNLPPVNGRELVADDVAWTYRHYTANSIQKARFAIVDRIDVPEKYTVVFTLKQPYSPFLVATLGYGAVTFLVLPHEIYEKNGNFNENPVGTGPWMLDRWDRGSKIALKANPDYWDMGADGKPLPYAASLTWFQYGDLAAVAA